MQTRSQEYQPFISLPSNEPLVIAWPTPNHALRDAPENFFARTRVNPDYGRPGWTRDCGKRLHRGCDIAPVNVTATGQTTTVMFTDCATGAEYGSEEPTYLSHDEVYAVYDGEIAEEVDDESASDYGRHIVIRHRWPVGGAVFYTVYAHLQEIERVPRSLSAPKRSRDRRAAAGTGAGGSPVGPNSDWDPSEPGNPRRVSGGQQIGVMGRSSRSADARNWMAIAPHLHFEVWDGERRPYNPVEFLGRYVDD